MTHYYVFYPYRRSTQFIVLRATGLQTVQMQRLCLKWQGDRVKELTRITEREARALLTAARQENRRRRERGAQVPDVAPETAQDAAAFLEMHPLPLTNAEIAQKWMPSHPLL